MLYVTLEWHWSDTGASLTVPLLLLWHQENATSLCVHMDIEPIVLLVSPSSVQISWVCERPQNLTYLMDLNTIWMLLFVCIFSCMIDIYWRREINEVSMLLFRLTSSMCLVKGVITCLRWSIFSICTSVQSHINCTKFAEVQECVLSPRWRHIRSPTLVLGCPLWTAANFTRWKGRLWCQKAVSLCANVFVIFV